MRITFHGAAGQVTGSAHLLEVEGRRILLDCGLFDSDRLDPQSANRSFTFDPRSIDVVVISHAHNDHIGRLPLLVKQGFQGPIFATPATADILAIMLRDSARIQREDARTLNAQNPFDEPVEPLYDLADVECVVDQITRLGYNRSSEILDGVELTYYNSGHILGSAIVQIDSLAAGKRKRLVFTGDLGRRDMGLLPDPEVVSNIDYLISESTYGGRSLEPYPVLIKQLHAIVARAIRKKSRIVIPAFSLGRTQRMVYCFLELFRMHKVRPIPIFVDSPLAMRLTEVHREYPDAYTPGARKVMEDGRGYFASRWVEFCSSWDDSKRINSIGGPVVIISSSGMCDAGRVRHHLRHTIENPDNAVVIVSYQAEGTLGRRIASGEDHIDILGETYELNAAVYVLDGFSGHADRDDLSAWYEACGGGIERAFLVHGEPESLEALAPRLQPYVGRPVEIPERLAEYEL